MPRPRLPTRGVVLWFDAPTYSVRGSNDPCRAVGSRGAAAGRSLQRPGPPTAAEATGRGRRLAPDALGEARLRRPGDSAVTRLRPGTSRPAAVSRMFRR